MLFTFILGTRCWKLRPRQRPHFHQWSLSKTPTHVWFFIIIIIKDELNIMGINIFNIEL